MSYLKRTVVIAALLLFIATPSMAEESAVTTVLKDTLYGTLSGGLVGGIVLLFARHPSSHLDWIGYGAAGGAVVGATYGAISTARALAEVENGEVKFAMPTIMPEFKEGPRGSTAFMASAQILRGTF